jgi:hypothetical protein
MKTRLTSLLFFQLKFTFLLALGAETPSFEGIAIEAASPNISYTMDAISDADEVTRRNIANYMAANPGAKPPINFETSEINHWEVTKSGSITFVVFTNKAGKRGEIWQNGHVTVMKLPGGASYFVEQVPADENYYHVNFGRFGYCHGSWITAENYVDKVKYNGAEALYFSDAKPPAKPNLQNKQAWVDFQTRRPLCIRENNITYTYKYLPPQILMIPKEVQVALATESKVIK